MLKSQKKIYSLGNVFNPILNKLKPYMDRPPTKEMGQRLINLLFEEGVEPPPHPVDAKGRYWFDNFHHYLEIIHSLERLCQAYGYLQKFPALRYYGFYRINELNWIRYHIEFFLQENYILHQRTVKWITFLLKRAKHKPSKKAIEVRLVKLRNQVNKGFADINRIRGQHVHGFTFEERDFERAEMAMFLISTLKQKRLAAIKSVTLVKIATKWRKKVKENVLSLIKSYDVILTGLSKIIAELE